MMRIYFQRFFKKHNQNFSFFECRDEKSMRIPIRFKMEKPRCVAVSKVVATSARVWSALPISNRERFGSRASEGWGVSTRSSLSSVKR